LALSWPVVFSPAWGGDHLVDGGGVGVGQQGEVAGDHVGAGPVDDPGGQQPGGVRQPLHLPGQLQLRLGGPRCQGERGGQLVGDVLTFSATGGGAAGVEFGGGGQFQGGLPGLDPAGGGQRPDQLVIGQLPEAALPGGAQVPGQVGAGQHLIDRSASAEPGRARDRAAVGEPGLDQVGEPVLVRVPGVEPVRVTVIAHHGAPLRVRHDLPALHRTVTGIEHEPVPLFLRRRLGIAIEVTVVRFGIPRLELKVGIQPAQRRDLRRG
jgi:hypothetical protein